MELEIGSSTLGIFLWTIFGAGLVMFMVLIVLGLVSYIKGVKAIKKHQGKKEFNNLAIAQYTVEKRMDSM